MRAVILAGGLGTRLNKIIKNLPKPMIKIGRLPILAHQVELFKKYGIKNITLATCYLSEVIEKYFKNGQDFGVRINYSKEENPLGTAGGLKEIESQLKNDFFLLYGDVMVDLDIAELISFHKSKKSACTLVLHPNDHPQDSDLVEIDGKQRIIAFHPKPHPENKYFNNLVNAGLYVLSPKILKYIKRGIKSDFGKDIFPKIFKKEKLYGYVTAEYLKDMGTPDRLAEVQKDYKSGKIAGLNRKNKRRAIFLDRDGVINDTSDDVCKTEDFKLFPWASEAIKKINASEFLAIVITNQPAVAKGFCSIEELDEIHKRMETLLGREGAKLDAVYFCPHHPDKGFAGENPKYKINCDCRKPKIGLVKRAEKDFNINLKKSYFIGDSWRDILCGKNAGVKTIKIEPGKKNLAQAVNSIYFLKPRQ
ncbi:MAG: HAD-IIIA family hydrolase [bacterium]|nr:HAD-IIIA family hydrolase [bacterium]